MSDGAPGLDRIVVGNGARIAYRVDGPPNAPALMLSASLGTTLHLWDGQMEVLARDWRVVRYDPRGHGRSTAPAGACGLDRRGQDVLDLMDALGLDRAAFCGLSMGGMVGQWLGVRAPERLTRLVLANTAAFMGPPDGWRGRIAQIRTEGMASLASSVLERWFTPAFLAESPLEVERIRAMLLATPARGYAGCCAAIRDMDQRATAVLIRAPTTVIAGRFDSATPPQDSAFLADRIPGARLVKLEAANLSNIEARDAFNACLGEALGDRCSVVGEPGGSTSSPRVRWAGSAPSATPGLSPERRRSRNGLVQAPKWRLVRSEGLH